MGMTVQKLIDELLKVEDKSKEVVYWIHGYYHGVDKVEEDEEGSLEYALSDVLEYAYLDDLLPERKEETNGGR